jgi:hypothetical protein
MVDRKVLDDRGVFTCDMEELQDRLDEVHCILEMIGERIERDSCEHARVVDGVARAIRTISYDLGNIDDVLRERGVIVEAAEAMERQRAAEAAPPAKVLPIIANKTARRSRKAVSK